MIKLENVSYSYGYSPSFALRDINLVLVKGEWVTVLGANGSGKSTLAKLLDGLILPTQGQVLVDGQSTADSRAIADIRQKVAFVFQNPDNQIVATSVEDDVAFGPENLGLEPEEISRRVERALNLTGLSKLAHKEPYLLSGGEKQRLAIAGALALSSDYLVLDEPTSMLDPQMGKQVLDVLLQLNRKLGLGIIFVTNLVEEALLADRVVVLKDGCLAAAGTPREIFSDPIKVESWGLEMPPYSYIAAKLTDRGFPGLRKAMTLEELVEGLCK